ncbi:MAG: hypothetical protein LBI33_11410 [Propionibacteriaceae bacterium]|jgi:hypothetical protein|nr:hypothetical protein [Propionibacteriaceae bacterium]
MTTETSRWAPQAPRLAVQGWLASRLALIITALVVAWQHNWSLKETLTRWDVVHYVTVAETGYTTLTQAAFFPGLPLILAACRLLGLPPLVTGVGVALVASGLAAWALYRLAGGSTRGLVAVLSWSLAPMAVFTIVPYTEAVFCAFAFWAWWYAKQNRWALAAGLAAAAALTRVSGLFLIGALGLLALLTAGRVTRRLVRVAWLGLPVAVLIAYAGFLRVRFGSWWAWFDAQRAGWARTFDWPWHAFAMTARAAGIGTPGDSNSVLFRWELVALALGLAVTIWSFAIRKIPEGAFVGAHVLALTCQIWIISLARGVVVWFPLFTTIGWVSTVGQGGGRHDIRRVAVVTFLGFEGVAMLWWATRFFTGAWSG